MLVSGSLVFAGAARQCFTHESRRFPVRPDNLKHTHTRYKVLLDDISEPMSSFVQQVREVHNPVDSTDQIGATSFFNSLLQAGAE